ncbi:MAG: hypothetical protein BGO21_20575 [Dyadobacter sp. 50-39]|jgi:hypothetical protein|uniref:hypothetical protein n=1 Tax=Dyadobacter sp. 50-39 TaxID=1895756 RepID=UPI00095AD173|nr:hypothetical protein [Dyadobacter sp. 50-39]OJV19107.1 MAG: hypothetical protein BGO21_20575 [Dyadobacter sp. 50-39]
MEDDSLAGSGKKKLPSKFDEEFDKKVNPDHEQERLEILMRADSVRGQQLAIDNEGQLFTRDEIRSFVLENVHDPSMMYDVYYKGIDKLLRGHLPKGPDFQKSRDLIYEEKNCFLTRGHRKNEKGIRGADSRMGHIEDAEIILNVVIDSVVNSRGVFEIYCAIRDLNVSRGYGIPVAEQ